MAEFIDDGDELEEDPFAWYYELEDNEEEYKWGEMSYYHFDKHTTWDDLELSDMDTFLLVG